jgi:cell division protein FtsW
VMYWYWGWRKRFVLASIIVWIAVATIVITQVSYINKRFAYFFSPESDKSWRGAWRQTKQAMIAIGWWWIFWQGYGKWLQKFWYIPEAQSDFVFAAFGEEIWFVWDTWLLALFFVLMWVFTTQLQRVNDQFYKLLWWWLIGWIIIQAFINIWVNTNLLPLTWLTLPFISTWWSSMMVNCVALILLFKIARLWQNPTLVN